MYLASKPVGTCMYTAAFYTYNTRPDSHTVIDRYATCAVAVKSKPLRHAVILF